MGRHFLPVTLVFALAACASPELLVGYSRPGMVVRVRESDGRVQWRDTEGGDLDEVLGVRRGPKVGPARRLYLCSYRANRVLVYRETAQSLEGELGCAGSLRGPTDLLFLPDGNVLVACSGSTQYLLDETFDGKGAELVLLAGPKSATPGSRITTLDKGDYAGVPTCLTLGPDGAAYVGGRDSGAILRVEGGQKPGVATFADIGNALARGPMHIAFGPDGTLYATSPFDTKVVRIESGKTTTFVDDSDLSKPAGLAFAKDGKHLFVASYGRGELRRYDATTGAYVDTLVDELPQPWAVIPR